MFSDDCPFFRRPIVGTHFEIFYLQQPMCVLAKHLLAALEERYSILIKSFMRECSEVIEKNTLQVHTINKLKRTLYKYIQ